MKSIKHPGAQRAIRRSVRTARALRRAARDRALRAFINEPIRHPRFAFVACASTFAGECEPMSDEEWDERNLDAIAADRLDGEGMAL